jgi:hypothetical protein
VASVTASDPSQPEPLSLLIRALGLAETILRDHVADPTGRYCLRCSPNRSVTWPCSLRFYATEALALDDQETS